MNERDATKTAKFLQKIDGVFADAFSSGEIDFIDAEAACLALMIKISRVFNVAPAKMVEDLAGAFVLESKLSGNGCDCDDCRAARAALAGNPDTTKN